jgi:hypothetical protein
VIDPFVIMRHPDGAAFNVLIDHHDPLGERRARLGVAGEAKRQPNAIPCPDHSSPYIHSTDGWLSEGRSASLD